MKTSDPGLAPTRRVRERISREFENDPKRLIEFYLKYQEKYADRLCVGREIETVSNTRGAGRSKGSEES